MSKKYICYGGWIRSHSDGDEHYIGARRLADLYNVPPAECIFVDDGHEDKLRGMTISNLIKLFPKSDGNYTIEVSYDQ